MGFLVILSHVFFRYLYTLMMEVTISHHLLQIS